MRIIKKFVYRVGLRPRRRSPFYSPSLSMIYGFKDNWNKRVWK